MFTEVVRGQIRICFVQYGFSHIALDLELPSISQKDNVKHDTTVSLSPIYIIRGCAMLEPLSAAYHVHPINDTYTTNMLIKEY